MTNHAENLEPGTQAIYLISANDLLLGDVVYLTHSGHWTRDLSEAWQLAAQDSALHQIELLQQTRSDVVGETLVKGQLGSDGVIRLDHFRDQFRQSGPTHRCELRRETHRL